MTDNSGKTNGTKNKSANVEVPLPLHESLLLKENNNETTAFLRVWMKKKNKKKNSLNRTTIRKSDYLTRT